MKVFRGFQHPQLAPTCALTIGNFDGVHRGHQAMLALLKSEAMHRGVPSCVMTFEPHPRDHFARLAGKPELAPARIATLRDKLQELARCGVDQVVVLPFDARLAGQSPQDFVQQVLVAGLGVRYVLVGDDFRFGAKRAGDFAMLDAAGRALGFDVARMNSYEISYPHRPDTPQAQPDEPTESTEFTESTESDKAPPACGLRVSSSAVREALAQARMHDVAALLGRPYSISGHVVHGRKLGRELRLAANTSDTSDGHDKGFRTLNLRFRHAKPAASGIFVVQVHGLSAQPLPGVANLGTRPSLDASDVNAGRVLLETHVLDWPAALGDEGAYSKIVRVDLLHKLHDELRYDSLEALTTGIAQDCQDARDWFASQHGKTHRQTTRDRI